MAICDLPSQEELLQRIAMPAESAPIPADARFQEDVVAVAVADGGRVVPRLFRRSDALALVLAEREIIRRAGPEQQAAEWERCRRSRFWFVSRWVDLETKFRIPGASRTVPFTPYPYQVRGIRLYDRARAESRWIFQDKSRQMGESWLFMALLLHDVRFEDQFSGLVTHRKELEVDDGGKGSTTKSLLGRLRFMAERLPAFLRKSGDHDALEFKHLLVRNEELGSFVVGEGSSPNIGRGGSFRVWLGDEWAHTEQSESAAASVNEAVEVGVLNSTPMGESNHFARTKAALAKPKGEGERQLRERYLVNRVHWSEHPLYSIGIEVDADGKLTSPWYRSACANLTDDLAAQEYDINYSRSLPGRWFPEFSYAKHVADEDIALHTGYWFYLSADHGLSDTEVWHLWQTDGATFLDLLDEWHSVPPGQHHGADLTSAEVAVGVVDWLASWGLTLARLEGIIPDPAGAARDETSGQSHHQMLQATWARMGHRIPAWYPANNSFTDGVESTRLLMKGVYNGQPFRFRVSPRCSLTIDSLVNYRRRIMRDGTVTDQEQRDWTNHASDSCRYMCHTMFPAIGDAAVEITEPQAYTSHQGRI